ncbi:MAG: class I SAM-dependent DNA methyltransferase [Chloroflexota bacterium]
MFEFGPATYGDRIAGVYDTWYSIPQDTDDTVAFLAPLAQGKSALELGIGSGRIALPLAARGMNVSGIDASEAMLEKLREKPGSEVVATYLGDFADVDVTGRFELIFAAFNTFFALASQDEQIRCFQNVAQRLDPGGAFVIEAFVPDLSRYSGNQDLATKAIEANLVVLDAAVHDPVTQTISVQHVVIGEWGVQLYPVLLRYAWPGELDLMARLAGLRLRDRWSGWLNEPFTAQSQKHVSVYTKDL